MSNEDFEKLGWINYLSKGRDKWEEFRKVDKKIQKHENGYKGGKGTKALEEWINDPELDGIRSTLHRSNGLMHSMVAECKAGLRMCAHQPVAAQRESTARIEGWIDKADFYIDAAEEYFKFLMDYGNSHDVDIKSSGSEGSVRNSTIHNQALKNNHSCKECYKRSEAYLKGDLQSTWFFYFLYVRSDNYETPPKIARSVVRFYNNVIEKEQSSEGWAEFDNIPGADSHDYTGLWSSIGKNDVLMLDLSNKKKTRNLHFKAEFKEDYRYVFATYTTFDATRIYSGSLVGEVIDDVIIKDLKKDRSGNPLITPFLFDYKNGRETCAEKLNESIYEFLAVKRRNHYLVPKARTNIVDFESTQHRRKRFRESRHRWLADYKKPTLFISFPQTSYSVGDNDGDLNNMELSFNNNKEFDKLNSSIAILAKKVETRLGFVQAVKAPLNKNNDEEIPFESLNQLKRTRYFVAIVESTAKYSFTMVQLGWALSYVPNCMILYKKEKDLNGDFIEIMSDRILALRELGVEIVSYSNLFEELEGNILESIVSFVKHRDDRLVVS